MVKGSADETSIRQQISIIENGVNYSTRRYNELRATNDRLTKELKQKLDRLNEEKNNFEDLDAMLKVCLFWIKNLSISSPVRREVKST